MPAKKNFSQCQSKKKASRVQNTRKYKEKRKLLQQQQEFMRKIQAVVNKILIIIRGRRGR